MLKDSRLLITHVPTLQVLKPLADAIGVTQAILLQQVHFLLTDPEKGYVKNNRKWVYNTIKQWQKKNFTFYSISTISRGFAALEKKELLLVDKPHKKRGNHTKSYSIDYNKVEALIMTESVKMNNSEFVNLNNSELFKMNDSSTKKPTKKTHTHSAKRVGVSHSQKQKEKEGNPPISESPPLMQENENADYIKVLEFLQLQPFSASSKKVAESKATEIMAATRAVSFFELALALDKMNFLHRQKAITSPDGFIRATSAFRNGKCIIGTSESYTPFWKRLQEQENTEKAERKKEIEGKKEHEEEEKIRASALEIYENLPPEEKQQIFDAAFSIAINTDFERERLKQNNNKLSFFQKENVNFAIVGIINEKVGK